MNQTAPAKGVVVVVGAGVIGITIALILQSQLRESHSIIVVARDFPPEESINYASMWAGAHVRPVPGNTQQLLKEGKWLKQTYDHFTRLIEEEPWAGVKKLEGIEYLAKPSADYISIAHGRSDGIVASTPGFRVLSKAELPKGIALGFRYDTFCVNSPMYCSYLLQKFRKDGGKTLRKSLVNGREGFTVAGDVKCVVNASGLGFGDLKSFPTRGQTCLVSNPCTATITRQNADGTWTFIIPRSYNGGTVIGGTKEPHDWTEEPIPEVRERLLSAAADMHPAILGAEGRFDVITDIVGRRPTREGGMRIEVEDRHSGSTGDGPVVHAYGAGGRGFEISWGVAQEVSRIVGTVVGDQPGTLKMAARL